MSCQQDFDEADTPNRAVLHSQLTNHQISGESTNTEPSSTLTENVGIGLAADIGKRCACMLLSKYAPCLGARNRTLF